MGGGVPEVSGAFVPGSGIVFKLTPNSDGSWNEDILYRFRGMGDGALPEDDRLVLDAAGNIFGTTSNGGADGLCPTGCGVVFKVEQ